LPVGAGPAPVAPLPCSASPARPAHTGARRGGTRRGEAAAARQARAAAARGGGRGGAVVACPARPGQGQAVALGCGASSNATRRHQRARWRGPEPRGGAWRGFGQLAGGVILRILRMVVLVVIRVPAGDTRPSGFQPTLFMVWLQPTKPVEPAHNKPFQDAATG